ncbi:MAG: cytochrome c3 family protein [Chthoniobacterales bacterium]
MNWLPLKLAICVGVLVTVISCGMWYYFTPKYTRVGYEPKQPVPFSHAIHVEQLGMDCRYCHSFVELSAHSNVPNTQTCINCHGPGKVKPTNPKLTAIRDSWNDGKQGGPAMQWVQVHQVPDYVYFNHAVHVNRGVSCYSCHGPVNKMEVIYQHEPQSMKWCLDCHRAPENFLRPPSEVFNMNWHAVSAKQQEEIGLEFKKEWDVHPPVTCGGCHR